MTPKRLLFRAAVRTMEWLSCVKPPSKCETYGLDLSLLPKGNDVIDVVTVAFNNDFILPLHVRYVERYLKGNVHQIVADNSTKEEASRKIRQWCEENGVAYIRLPRNYSNKIGCSYSHATALNYVYEKIIAVRKPHYFGIVDHDLFPVTEVEVTTILDRQHVYGPIRRRGDGGAWYLSGVMCFFDREWTEGKRVDFMPVQVEGGVYLDAGGGNWKGCYSRMDVKSMQFCEEEMERLRDGDNRYSDMVEIFDRKWVHTINGSYYKQVAEKKESILEELLEGYERRYGQTEKVEIG